MTCSQRQTEFLKTKSNIGQKYVDTYEDTTVGVWKWKWSQETENSNHRFKSATAVRQHNTDVGLSRYY